MAGDQDEAKTEAASASDGDRTETPTGKDAARRRRPPVRPRDGNVGQTLRTVYQQTVNEDVPSEMLDLLGKLA